MMIIDGGQELWTGDTYPMLGCAACGCEYVHHFEVDVFTRHGEDNDRGIAVHIGMRGIPSVTTDTSERAGNPSSRRSGLVVRFWCESCEAISALELAQHKGVTFIDTKVVGSLRDRETAA